MEENWGSWAIGQCRSNLPIRGKLPSHGPFNFRCFLPANLNRNPLPARAFTARIGPPAGSFAQPLLQHNRRGHFIEHAFFLPFLF